MGGGGGGGEGEEEAFCGVAAVPSRHERSAASDSTREHD